MNLPMKTYKHQEETKVVDFFQCAFIRTCVT